MGVHIMPVNIVVMYRGPKALLKNMPGVHLRTPHLLLPYDACQMGSPASASSDQRVWVNVMGQLGRLERYIDGLPHKVSALPYPPY